MTAFARIIVLGAQALVVLVGLFSSLGPCLDGSLRGIVIFATFAVWAVCLGVFVGSRSRPALIACQTFAILLTAYFAWVVLTGRGPAGEAISKWPGEMGGLVGLVAIPCFVVSLCLAVALRRLWPDPIKK